jgi:replication factor A1
LTLWGKQAEQFDGSQMPILAAKGAKVSDFGGRSLSLFASSAMTINPDIPEAHRLRGWFDSQGHNAAFSAFSGQMSSLGGQNLPQQTIAQAKEELLGLTDKGDFFAVRATVLFFKEDNFSYPGCPTCSKKLIDEGISSWRCEKCQKTFPEPEYRYILSVSISDHTGQMWLQGFNDIGVLLLGRKANELHSLKELNDEAFKFVIAEANFKQYVFRCRAKQETYNEMTRIKYSIMSATPVSYVESGKDLVGLIEQYETC